MASPYYRFGYQGAQYPFNWHGGAGGVPWSRVAAQTRELSDYDIEDSGLTPYSMNYPALRGNIASGDWPALRPAGPEPLDPMGGILDLSDNEKKLAMLAAAAGAFWWFFMKKKKR
ncbi:MAG: hypothetical protein KJO40_13555 [Deltaproteobacteria bacterium]|nr:hypothetical protein [Deltaproteobacteria bacterium]